MSQQHRNNRNRGGGGNNNRYKPHPDLEAASTYFKNNKGQLLNFKNANDLPSIIDHLKNYVQYGAKDLTTSQLRNIYGEIKKAKTVLEMQLLRPKMAYVVARQHEKSDARKVITLIDDVIKELKEEPQVSNVQAFVEAIVAYHKFYHPKK